MLSCETRSIPSPFDSFQADQQPYEPAAAAAEHRGQHPLPPTLDHQKKRHIKSNTELLPWDVVVRVSQQEEYGEGQVG